MNGHGYSLERALAAQHDQYRAQGVADIVQVPTPVTVLGRTMQDARGRAVFRGAMAARSGVDFVGWALPSIGSRPVPVLLEAKAHAGRESWSVDCVLPQQAEQLHRGARSGVLALVLLRAWGPLWALEWARIAGHVAAAGRRTIRASEVESLGRIVDGYDWLKHWR